MSLGQKEDDGPPGVYMSDSVRFVQLSDGNMAIQKVSVAPVGKDSITIETTVRGTRRLAENHATNRARMRLVSGLARPCDWGIHAALVWGKGVEITMKIGTADENLMPRSVWNIKHLEYNLHSHRHHLKYTTWLELSISFWTAHLY